MLKEKYEQIALHPQYITSTIDNESEHVDYSTLLALDEKEEKGNDMGDDEMVEVLLVSDEFALKPEDDESVEEYEILEVEQSDYNAATEADLSEVKNIEIIGENDRFIHESEPIEDEPIVEKAKQVKLPVAGVRRSLRGSVQKKSSKEEEAKPPNDRQTRKCSVRTQEKASQKRKHDARSDGNQNPAKIQRTHSGETEDFAEEAEEGESGDECPARDSDNDDWPGLQTISEFPKEILRNGYLLIKGKQLMSMICK